MEAELNLLEQMAKIQGIIRGKEESEKREQDKLVAAQKDREEKVAREKKEMEEAMREVKREKDRLRKERTKAKEEYFFP